MKKTTANLLLLTGFACIAQSASAAILVTGAGFTETFDAVPAATDWSTLSLAGVSTVGNAENLIDLAGVTNRFNVDYDGGAAQTGPLLTSLITAQLATTPATGTALATARVNGGALLSQPTGNGGLVFMATVQNATGFLTNNLAVSFDLLNTAASLEQVGGYLVFYTTNNGTSWTNAATINPIPTGAINPAQKFSFNVPVSLSPNGQVQIAWFDDNSSGTEGQYQMDNVNFTLNQVPEPSTYALLGLGLAVVAWRRRR